MSWVPPSVELHLCRSADTAWSEVVRPWLTAGPDRLSRRIVVVPTRGQSLALKQRCLEEHLPLLGVEFLSPRLAWQKWLALARPVRPALDRRLLLLGLRTLLAHRLAALATVEPPPDGVGLLKSLQSDADRALDSFEELMGAGFHPGDFGLPPLREIFGELAGWARGLGYELHGTLAREAAGALVPPTASRIADAVLVYGLSPEEWNEFFGVAALARRGRQLTVVLPEPVLRGRGLDEQWVTLWEDLLGIEAAMHPEEGSRPTGAPVGQVLTGEAPPVGDLPYEIIVGRTQRDEMTLVAEKIESLLANGATAIGVVFPHAESGHRRLAALLAQRAVAFVDLIETPGAPPVEARVQRALLEFYQSGGRLEPFLALWALLRTLGWAGVASGAVRSVCESLFEECQSHLLQTCIDHMAGDTHADRQAVRELADRLLPAWPAELTLAAALARFAAVCDAFRLGRPSDWNTLEAFAERETRALPLPIVTATLAAFLPTASPAFVAGKGGFGRVILTTRRRATWVPWSHVIFTQATAGNWPTRKEPGPWLTDETRAALNQVAPFTLGLFTQGDAAQMERDAYAAITRDTRERVVFSAALADDRDPEMKQAPNVWVERLLFWERGNEPDWSLDRTWEALATGPPATVPTPTADLRVWREVWEGRRNPRRPFDEHFYCVDPVKVCPSSVAAGLVERGVSDPVELWYGAVLGLAAVDWRPFVQAARTALGRFAHQVLAGALRGETRDGAFHELPSPDVCRARLAAGLVAWRQGRPVNRFWDSFHAELTLVARLLLEKVLALDAGRYLVVEWRLPRGIALPVGGGRVEVSGRMDVALADRPRWEGSAVNVIDFKTGAVRALSAARMAEKGEGLQLGVYLAAARELGASTGRVWMLKPGPGEEWSVAMADLETALARLARLWEHLRTGRYGQLTPDRSDFTHNFEPPLADTPVKHAVLAEKYAATFGATREPEGDEDE